MAAQLLQLKLRLLGNSLQRSAWRLVGLVIGLLYGFAVTVFAVFALFALRLVAADVAGSVVATGGALVVLGFFLVPLVVGTDDAMDPRGFALYGIESGRLATGLALAALIGIPSLVIGAVAAAQVVTWSRGPLPVVIAIAGAAVIVATCVLGSRVMTSVAAFLLSTRRARDFTAIIGVLVLLLLAPLFSVASNVNWGTDGFAVLARIGAVAGWTPFGAAWSAPADAALGLSGQALVKLFLALVFAAVLWFAWRYLVAAMLVTPHREAQARNYHGLGWFAVFPSNSTGAIAARSLTYWGRDARYFVSLIIVPIVPVIMIVPLIVAGIPVPPLALLPVPVAALFLGWSTHNDVAFDHTALWLHVVSGTSGRADRLGRAIPALAAGVPALAVGALASAEVFGDRAVLPSLIGVSFGMLLCGLGLSSVMSAWFPYPVVHPGDSPFSQPQSSGTAAALIQALSFFATLVLAAPALAFAALGLAEGGAWPWASFTVGTGLGLVIFAGGVVLGGRIFDRRSTDLLAFSMRN